MTQAILFAVAAFIATLIILGWAYNEEHYGRDLVKSLVRVPFAVLLFFIPLVAIIYLVEKGFIQ